MDNIDDCSVNASEHRGDCSLFRLEILPKFIGRGATVKGYTFEKKLICFKRDQLHCCSLPIDPSDQRGKCSLSRLNRLETEIVGKFQKVITWSPATKDHT